MSIIFSMLIWAIRVFTVIKVLAKKLLGIVGIIIGLN
jgi:hypothetical protein